MTKFLDRLPSLLLGFCAGMLLFSGLAFIVWILLPAFEYIKYIPAFVKEIWLLIPLWAKLVALAGGVFGAIKLSE